MIPLLLSLSLLLGSTTPPIEPASVEALLALRKALGPAAKETKSEVKTREGKGPAGTILISAWVPGAYPGSAIANAIVYDKQHYGQYGQGFAALARRAKWHSKSPTATELAQIFTLGWMPGLAPDSKVESLKKVKGSLVLEFTGRPPLGHGRSRVVVTIPAKKGAATTVVTPIIGKQ